MRLKQNEEKAIAWYQDKNNLRVQLSSLPMIYFLDEDNQEHIMLLWSIVAMWEKAKKEEKRNKGA